MKILIIGFTKIKYMPYLTFYLNAIDFKTNDVTVLYWNRDINPDSELEPYIEKIEFKKNLLDSEKKIKKVPAFIAFRRKAIKVINKGNYDRIIVLHTLPAILISDILLRSFKNRFILDYRDYTFEKNRIYKSIVGKLVKASCCCFVSSNAFRVYLPNVDKIYTSHNLMISTINNRPSKHSLSLDPIRIRYWGLIRYADTNIKIIEQIKNDPRFEFHFHGRLQGEAAIIQQYCQEHDVSNVFFHGEYKPEDRLSFAMETDLIQNAQDYDEITKNAVSNKFYDGPIFYIPQICTRNSYMGSCLEKYKIGLPIDIDSEDFATTIYKYLSELNTNDFAKKCDKFVNMVLEEYMNGLDILNKVLNTEGLT